MSNIVTTLLFLFLSQQSQASADCSFSTNSDLFEYKKFEERLSQELLAKNYLYSETSPNKIGITITKIVPNLKTIALDDDTDCGPGNSLFSCSVSINSNKYFTGSISQQIRACVPNGHAPVFNDSNLCFEAIEKLSIPSCLGNVKPAENFTPCLNCDFFVNEFNGGLQEYTGQNKAYKINYKKQDIDIVLSNKYTNTNIVEPTFSEDKLEFEITTWEKKQFISIETRSFITPEFKSYLKGYYEINCEYSWQKDCGPGYYKPFSFGGKFDIYPLDELSKIFLIRINFQLPNTDQISFFVYNALTKEIRVHTETPWLQNVDYYHMKSQPVFAKWLQVDFSNLDYFPINLVRYDWDSNSFLPAGVLPEAPLVDRSFITNVYSPTNWIPLSRSISAKPVYSHVKYRVDSHHSRETTNVDVFFYNFDTQETISVREFFRPISDTKPGKFQLYPSQDNLFLVSLKEFPFSSTHTLAKFSLKNIEKFGRKAKPYFKIDISDYGVTPLDAALDDGTFFVIRGEYLAMMKVESDGKVLIRDVMPTWQYENSHQAGSIYRSAAAYISGFFYFYVKTLNGGVGSDDPNPRLWKVNIMTGEAEQLRCGYDRWPSCSTFL